VKEEAEKNLDLSSRSWLSSFHAQSFVFCWSFQDAILSEHATNCRDFIIINSWIREEKIKEATEERRRRKMSSERILTFI
jgi:hypothetical protein